MTTHNNPGIAVKRFWTEYRPWKGEKPEGAPELEARDMIEYGPIGELDKSTTVASVRSLSKVMPLRDHAGNLAVIMANARWDAIKPRYDAWKSGQEMPISGTPLGAWSAISPEQAEVFKARGIRTIEEVASLSDGHVERIPVPHMRDLVRQAQLFMENADTTRVASHIAQSEQRNAALEVTIDEQAAQIKDLMAKVEMLAKAVAAQPDEADAPSEAEPAKRTRAKTAQAA